MIKKSIFFLIFAITAAAAFLFLNHTWDIEKDILYLKNENTIASDKTRETGERIYYEADGTTFFVDKNDVEYIGYGEFQETIDGQEYLSRKFNQLKGKLQLVLEPWEAESAKAKKWLAAVRNNLLAGLLLMATLPVAYLMIRRFRRNPQKPATKPIEKKAVTAGMTAKKAREENNQNISDALKIVKFFLELFRLQTGAPEDAPTDLSPLDIRTIGKNQVYELRVLHAGEWVSRRMSIGPLGEESGSKSKCFYVIYDVHMVLKIPPKKLTDFNAYIQTIKSDRHIVERLAPKECIVPKISVILKRVYTFPGEARMTPEKLEEKYIQLLGNRPALQEYLKIDGRFVFFMDLSKYYFLGHIIETIHDLDQKVFQEITMNSGIIWDAQGFAGRYGQSNGAICFKLQNIYTEFEREMRNYFASPENSETVHQYQIRNWFLIHLTGNRVKPDRETPDDEKISKINSTAESLFKKRPDEIAAYRKSVQKYVHDISCAQNKAQMESISTNILSLLTWLGEKKIAMRDLKPDNLLVAGDPADYPNFLKSYGKFSIGLIDVETAVDYHAAKEKNIPQPQLGGTPNYATPTHLFGNVILNSVYDDLALILHLQDWHATTAIIYKVATGKNLFNNTGKSLPGIIKKIHRAVADKKLNKEVVKEVSQMFWQSAVGEFNLKVRKNESYLTSLIVALPQNVKNNIRKEVVRAEKEIVNTIKEVIRSQTAFTDGNTRKQVEMASAGKIITLKAKLEKEDNVSVSDKTEKINVLKILERLKLKSDRLSQALDKLNTPHAKLTVYELLTLMFSVGFNSMFRPEWTTGFEKKSAKQSKTNKKIVKSAK
ncbi:MAG: hypothetical protein R6X10_00285 [Desulfobacterales bacterium]